MLTLQSRIITELEFDQIDNPIWNRATDSESSDPCFPVSLWGSAHPCNR